MSATERARDARILRVEEILLREFPGELGAVDDLRAVEANLAALASALEDAKRLNSFEGGNDVLAHLWERAENAERENQLLREALSFYSIATFHDWSEDCGKLAGEALAEGRQT